MRTISYELRSYVKRNPLQESGRRDMLFHQLISSHAPDLKGQLVSVIGGGGKSTLIEKIGWELVERAFKVILTCTTKFQPIANIELILERENPHFLPNISTSLKKNNIAAAASDFYRGETLVGLEPSNFRDLRNLADIVLIEADGCRQRCLKTHKEYEPVIPPLTSCVIIICGANVVNQPLNEENVHRSALFSQKWNLPIGSSLTPDHVANELVSESSYLKSIPQNAQVVYFINKSDLNPTGAKSLSHALQKRTSHPIFYGSLKENSLHRARD